MNVGDKVKNIVKLYATSSIIPIGTIGTIRQIDRLHDGSVALFGYEVAFEGFPMETFPCAPKEIKVVG